MYKYFLILFFLSLFFLKIINDFEYMDNQTYNVYLIANNKDLSDDYIKKINLIKPLKKDKIVRFNHSGNGKIFNNKVNIAVFRRNKISYWGFRKPIWNFLNSKNVILLGKSKFFKNSVRYFKEKNNQVKCILYKSKKIKTPSSGFIIIKYFLKNPNVDKIYLVGFDFHSDQRLNHGDKHWHNFYNEEKFIKKYPNKIIQL